MDRGRRGSIVGSSDPKKRGKQQTVPEKSSAGPLSQHEKFKGSMVAPTLAVDDTSLVIDPNLLVGPLYVPQTSRTDRIKEQLGDITEKLHKTLYNFDEFDDFEHEDPVAQMRERIGQVDDHDMRSNLASFMDRFEDMSSQVAEANKDRDEMLLQLADWFTTDHVDLDDIKSSVDEAEEENMKQSYFQTMTNFEKLKKVQNQIKNASKLGKPTRQLQQKKIELEKDVVGHFKVMKDMSMQTKLKVSDDAPWKHAANEIVAMLKNVRSENAHEIEAISKKMQEMVDQLEKQARTIRSMSAELREKKQVVQKLTDENGDLSQDVMLLRNRYTRYEKDLETAQALIRKLHAQKLAEGQTLSVPEDTAVGKSLAASVSKVLTQFTEPEHGVKRMSSDPAMLRTKLREYQDALDSIKSEYSRAAEEVEELNVELEEKKTYIASIEAENEKLLKDVKKLRQERRQSVAAGFIPPAAGGDMHKCEHCKCHVKDNEFEDEIAELKKESAKWLEKCNYFKKCLADTEMKLSDAFKEISDLRMDRELPPPAIPAPVPQEQEAPADKKDEPTPEKTEKSKEQAPPKETKPKPKPKRDVKPRYLEKKAESARAHPLPPIEQTPLDEIIEHMPDLTRKQNREMKLYRAGDIQGKLNMLVSEIMEFVSEIGKMLFVEKRDEGQKIQAMKAFNFESQTPAKKQKEDRDPKEEEAKQKKNMVIFCGQHACAKLREAYETLSSSLHLQHNEYEAIYRSFKISQQRNSIRREVIMGRMPITALHEFDKQQKKKMRESGGADSLLHAYFNISYGGGAGLGMAATNKLRQSGLHRRESSVLSFHSESADESEAKLKNTMHVLSVQRSKSDLDVRDTPNSLANVTMLGGGIMKERGHVFMPTSSEQIHRDSMAGGQRQEMRVGMATVNKKGLISLSTTDDSNQLPELTATGESHRQPEHAPGKQRTRTLIKRKDIMDHFKAGFKILEDEELQKHQEEELQKSLGDYTIMDLQSKILEMTDAKSVRRVPGAESPVSPTGSRKVPQQMKQEKTITLPAIKNFNPFAMKS